MKKTIIFFGLIIFLVAFGNNAVRQTSQDAFQKALVKEQAEGNLEEAIALFQKVVDKGDDEALAAQAQLHIGICYEKMGLSKARDAYQKVIDRYPKQAEVVKTARAKLAILQKALAAVESGEKELKLRMVLSDLTVDGLGAVSRDGKYYSFMDYETGDLAIKDMATGKKRRLTDKGPWDKSPELALFSRWSRDGRHIVFNWVTDKGFLDLLVIGLDGAAARILFNGKEEEYIHPLDFSPDGKSVLAGYWKANAGYELRLINVMDGASKTLKSAKKADSLMFKFSPDGRYIAYDFTPQEDILEHDIYLLSVAGGQEMPVFQHPADDLFLDWTPDGKGILFLSDRTGTLGVWLVQIEGAKPKGEPQLMKSDIGRIDPMGVTEDGSFYFSVSKMMFDIYVAKIDPAKGKILELPVKAPQRFEGSNMSAAWSPDGKYLAYVSKRGPLARDRALLIRTLETGKERELRPRLSGYSYPRWSPDGRRILLQSGNGYYEVDIETENAAPLLLGKGKADIDTPQYAPDGKFLYYVLGNQTKNLRKIMVRDLKTGDERELYSVPADDIYIALSKDGQRLAILNRAKDRSLKIMPSSGGEPQEIHKFEQGGNFIISMTWTADGRYILFSKKKLNAETLWELFRIPAEGGEPQNLGITMNTIGHLSVHPDGQRILFWSRGFQDIKDTPGELLMKFEDFSQNISAKSSCGQSAYQDICVEENPHEISEKISSSVRYPRASAKGMILFRSSSNCSSRSCLRKDSRAISLRFFPERRLALVSSRFSSSSRRMVKIAVFMSYIVIQSP